MTKLLEYAARTPALTELQEAARRRIPTALTGVPEGMAAFVGAALAEAGLRVLLVSPSDVRAARAGDDALQLCGDASALLQSGVLDLTRGASSHENAWRRLETLSRVARGGVRLLVTSAEAVIQRMGDPAAFSGALIHLGAGDRIRPEELIRRLIAMGYERVEMVEGKGQCALRGAILDVYPPSASAGYRIEFFDDEVDSVRSFDCISQRSLERVRGADLTPASEVLLTAAQGAEAARHMREALAALRPAEKAVSVFDDISDSEEGDDAAVFDAKVAPKVRKKEEQTVRRADTERRITAMEADADLVESGIPFRRISTWLTVLGLPGHTLCDWYQPEVILLCQPDQIRTRAEERRRGFMEDLSAAMERSEAVQAQEDLLLTWEEALSALKGWPLVTVTELLLGQGGIPVERSIDLRAKPMDSYQSRMRELAEQCLRWQGQGYATLLLAGGVSRGKRLAETLREWKLTASVAEESDLPHAPGSTLIRPVSLSHGFLWPEGRIALVTDTELYGTGYRKAKSRRSAGERIAAFTDLKEGDYVVHEDHGIGIYQGTVRLQSEGAWRDYLLIQYLGSDKLYVPIEQLERVQRYIGNPDQPPKLNRIGGGDWQKQKGKVREGLKKLAFDLVQLYARRTQSQGHAFAPDTPWQRQFEDQFPYELTPDQAQSVAEITHDMESPHNMDRLLCGDVGYGKTEVSLRAAFKAVMDGKQVAILAPTTILAQQHFHTVQKRFAGFPVTAEMLSRFRTAKEQKDVIARLKEGRIDILVGTHRMLGKDVQFKDLGLLIVDEEQRFGVAHKEIIKNMKSQVDVLTLTATPIPRTLHMSMVGIRDMSVLETPPEDRLPVQTHVLEYSDAIIRDAILRELARGGQVYFLYNRVHHIEEFYNRLRELVPEARIGVAHGQMKEHGLEDVMMDFYAGSYDVLLCTTIIESGLDVPTANTLIVYDADRFGLSQLYQLRGRVGRSSRQAYAYFTVRPDKMLSETAEQRLSAIRQFTEFGSGFRIAMRDLEIRGAGNILGPEQHGHLETVGYDMYCKLMEETLIEAKGGETPPELETRVELHVDAFLPEDYVRDSRQRMEMYKRIAAINTQEDREDITDELIDRFGELPPQVESLLDIAQLRSLCCRAGVSLVTYRKGGFLMMRLDEKAAPDPLLLVQAMEAADSRLTLTSRKPWAILLTDTRLQERDMLPEGVKVMKRLIGFMTVQSQQNAVQ